MRKAPHYVQRQVKEEKATAWILSSSSESG